jgi:hypothetical protein
MPCNCTTGAGSPEGVVAGAVGDLYAQSNGLNGDTLWRKRVATAGSPPSATKGWGLIQSSLNIINVRDFGAIGDGNVNDTTAIQQATAAAQAAGKVLVFPPGTYKYDSAPNWAIPRFRVLGIDEVVLKFIGSNACVKFDGGGTPVFDCTLENVTIQGNASATIGLYSSNVHHSMFRNVRIVDVTEVGLKVEFAVLNTYDNIVISANEFEFNFVPSIGVKLDKHPTQEKDSSDCTFLNLMVERAKDCGLLLQRASGCVFLGGTSEHNDLLAGEGVGVRIESVSTRNTFVGFFCEDNKGGDLICSGSRNQFVNCTFNSRAPSAPYESLKGIILESGSEQNAFHGGVFFAASVEAGSVANLFGQVNSGFKIFDSGTDTIVLASRQLNLTAGVQRSKLPQVDPFAPLSTVNGWGHTTGVFHTPGYTINRSTQEVIVRGTVGGGASNSIIATLPSGYRPTKQLFFTCASPDTGAPVLLRVTTAGAIQHMSGVITGVDLSGVRFFID